MIENWTRMKLALEESYIGFLHYWNGLFLLEKIFHLSIVIHLGLIFVNVILVGLPLRKYYKDDILIHGIRLISIVCSRGMSEKYLGESMESVQAKLNRFQLGLCYYLHYVGILLAILFALCLVYFAYEWIPPFGSLD